MGILIGNGDLSYGRRAGRVGRRFVGGGAHAQAAAPAPSVPVFFDPTGKRWRRVLAGIVLCLATLTGTVAWVVPQALSPTWEQPLNQELGYPAELLASGDVYNIPLLGTDTGFAFARMALVKRENGAVFLADPFSDEVFRTVTDEEAELIGDSPYAMERFGTPADGQLMITFDDGPDATFTPEILDVLSAEGVPATFFDIGTNVVKNPDVFERVIREGHMVGNHTMTHFTGWDDEGAQQREELVGTDRTMRAVGSYASRLFRLPEGDPENNALGLLQAQQLGYIHVDMDLDTLDWSYAPGEEIVLPELDGKGHIVLMHDGGGDRSGTVEMLKGLIADAKAKGYQFSTVAPLLPEEYMPQHDAQGTWVDDVTAGALASVVVAPDVVITWLFWFGTGSLAIMTLLYIVLALMNNHRQRRRTWTEPDEDKLPLVSVVLPVFNEEPVIRRTLDALKSSDYPSFEVVAIDDGSTDSTLRILRDYAREWPQLRVLTQLNAGKSVASNLGIGAARGEIVVTLDGDTIFEPHTIRVLARHFYQENDGGKPVGAVAGHVKVGNRKNVLTAWQSLEYISGIVVTRMAEGLVGAISICPGACAAWRREALVRVGGYSHDTMAEDADLTLSIQKMGYSIVQENEAVAWTEAPMTMSGLAKQRLRWTYGNLQALRKHAGMIFRPKYGALGMVALPHTLLSTAVPLVFLPLTIVMAGASLMAGSWQNIALFALFVALTHAIMCAIAIYMVRESPRHLLMVPLYRVIYEPLRAYLLYASVIQALKGKAVGWYKPERTNTVFSGAGEPEPESA
ncbi:bifunctional polysaccharide deacetylase/glycosyltransferase family 2 protein [Arthrobacter halodurans]|uniref:Bifunctional polysaccharide deacetylase/glycosyltransferase family 2 protein n=1 Tax=Arthrobacter halodurans TaxID=516699 RepID=A0ABV4UPN4_9MICC